MTTEHRDHYGNYSVTDLQSCHDALLSDIEQAEERLGMLLEAAKPLMDAHEAGIPLDRGDHRWTRLRAAIDIEGGT